MRTLVCGGRKYSDRHTLFSVLDVLHQEFVISCVINGNATGADSLSTEWAIKCLIPYSLYLADWKKFGKAAGMIRNQTMFDNSTPDMAVAFPGGSGTESMIKIVKRAEYQTLIDCEDFKVFLKPAG